MNHSHIDTLVCPSAATQKHNTARGPCPPRRKCSGWTATTVIALFFAALGYAQTPLLIREFPVHASNSQLTSMVAGPDGAMWFTETGAIGRVDGNGAISEYFLPTASTYPQSIVVGKDEALWFAEASVPRIGRITTSGAITEFVIPNGAVFITPGSDGALWFNSDNNTTSYFIGRITTGGTVTTYTTSSYITAMASGSDGAVWFAEASGKLGRITTSGSITEYPLPDPNADPFQITTGPDGALWFTETGDNKIGRITTDGIISEYAVSAQDSGPTGICSGPDGAIWFVDFGGKHVGRVTMAGVVSEFAVPAAGGALRQILPGPDGALWFAEADSANAISNIARVSTTGVVEEFPTPTSNAFPGPLAVGFDSKLWFVELGKVARIETSPTGPLRITTAPPLPIGIVGAPYSWYLTAFGGNAPYSWAVASGALPSGLALSAAGAITGTPAATGPQTFMVQVTDSSAAVVTLTLSMAVSTPNCTYLGHANPSGPSVHFPPQGGTGSITVIAAAGCYWNVLGAPGWLTITSGATGAGNGVVNLSAAVNRLPTPASATLNIGGFQGLTIYVNLLPAYPSGNYGTMPHLVAEGGWRTTLTLVNKSGTATEGQLSLLDNSGNPLALPLTYTQQSSAISQTATSVDQSIPGNGALNVVASGSADIPYVEGSAQVMPGSVVDGFAIFHYDPSGCQRFLEMSPCSVH